MPKKSTNTELFLELAQPDKQGFSRKVSTDKFVGRYASLKLGNGGSWCREVSKLGNTYNIERGKEPGKGNKIVYVRLHGFKKEPMRKPIPSWVRKALQDLPCVVLGIHKVEIDHKDGRRDNNPGLNERLNDPKRLRKDDFQPLSKAANDAKRQHCKRCRETNKRFDAKTLGFVKSQVKGDGKYRGTCVGCYWHDPVYFRTRVATGNQNDDGETDI